MQTDSRQRHNAEREEDAVTHKAIEALSADREALLEIGASLSEAEWASESGCPGWSVQDVVAHLGALYWGVVDPSTLPDVSDVLDLSDVSDVLDLSDVSDVLDLSDVPTERAQDTFVQHRRSWTPSQVLADYEAVSAQALKALEGLADQEFLVPLGDLGTYPASRLASAFAFDHFLHIRSDLFAPRGPLTGTPPPSDQLHLGPVLDWIEAALPQQNAELLAGLHSAVEIDLHGPGARLFRLGPGEAATLVRSDTLSFVRWVTHRTTWHAAGVESSGNESDLAITRSLRVF
jgi:uncharacterized protein (TIGR03083 family)